MDIKKARDILGKDAEDQTNEHVQETIDTAQILEDIVLDTVLKMSPQKRKELQKKFKQQK